MKSRQTLPTLPDTETHVRGHAGSVGDAAGTLGCLGTRRGGSGLLLWKRK